MFFRLKEHGQNVDSFDLNDLKIVHISALDEVYSKDIHLLMITKNGLRIFITFATRYVDPVEPYLTKYVTCDRPQQDFDIYFVKWPIILPNKRTMTPNELIMDKKSIIASTQQNRKMINGFLDKSTCMMIDSKDNLTITDDLSFKAIYFYSINLSKIALTQENENNKKLIENAGIIKLSTDYFDEDLIISQIPTGSLVSSTVSQLLDYKMNELLKSNGRNETLINKEYFLGGKTGSFSYNCLHDLSKQVYLPASHYLFLTSESLEFVLKARPIDLLFQILNIVNNETSIDDFEFNKFVKCYGGIETCCMLLEIICNNDMSYYFNESMDRKLKEDHFFRTKQIINLEKTYQNSNKQDIKYIKSSEEVIYKAINAFFNLGDSIPEIKEELNDRRDFFEGYGRTIHPEKKRYTYKMEGFLLYFSRLIRPIWNKHIVNKSVYELLIYDRLENFTEEELQLVRKRVLEIKNFMDSKNDRLLINNSSGFDGAVMKNKIKNILDFSSYKTQQENMANKDITVNFNKKNVEEILWDEKVINFFFEFLKKIFDFNDFSSLLLNKNYYYIEYFNVSFLFYQNK